MVLVAVAVAIVGVVVLRGQIELMELGLTPYQIALMFTECSLVMFVVQSIVFSPWIKPKTTRWFIAPALAILAAGLFLVPRAPDFTLTLAEIGAVAASVGILSPIMTYWISIKAGKAQGAELGKQTAASSLGAAVGSAAGGLLFDVVSPPHASFLLVAANRPGCPAEPRPPECARKTEDRRSHLRRGEPRRVLDWTDLSRVPSHCC
jgi:hypothetical protein